MLYQQIAQNKRKTILVMAGFFALVSVIGAAIVATFLRSWLFGLVLAIILGVFYALSMMSNSIDVVMKMNRATEITDKQQAPELWNIIEDMALVGKVSMPRVFIIDDPSPNAFATGNDPQHSAVAVTKGLLQRLNREELEGVIAHEVSHIRNYDIRLQTTAIALTSAISLLASIGQSAYFWGGGRRRDDEEKSGGLELLFSILAILAIILGPIAATLVQMALSRNREYLADASAVELTRNPYGLISALQKISNSEPMQHVDQSSAALYITNPLKGKDLFATHPPIQDRIERLQKM